MVILGAGLGEFGLMVFQLAQGSVEIEAIRSFQCPPSCKKLVHRWRDTAQQPDVRTV